uniref:BHLH domain-containing protein n=1 Tax=Macrostomum lignano TaxID=282301 RepID=A0A1I8JLV0_9PLAT
QQQQQQLNQSTPSSAAAASSPVESPENSADSADLQLPNDMDMDLDISELLGDDSDFAHLSSTAPNPAHFPISSGQTFSGFTGLRDGDGDGSDPPSVMEAKPSTSAPASTHLFLTGGSRLSAHQLQQQQQQQQQQSSLAPASLGSSDSRAASVASSLATAGGPPRDRSKKDSHNRIERKRRENINHQIAELGEILPRGYFQDSDLKKNKGNILKASVDYIRELQAEQMKLSDRVAQSETRAEKLDQLSRALAMQIQNMQQTLSTHGVQYQQANSLDEGVVHGLLNFLVSSSPSSSTRVKAEPTTGLQQQQQQ